MSNRGGSVAGIKRRTSSVPHGLLETPHRRVLCPGGATFSAVGFPSGAADSREFPLVETTRSPVRLPSCQVAPRHPVPGGPRSLPGGASSGPLHSVRNGSVPGAVALGGYWQVRGSATLGACPEMAVSVGCRVAYRLLAAADSVRSGGSVVLGAGTARCAGVRGHRTRRVLAALEVAVLGRWPGFRWMRAAVRALAGVDGAPLGAPLEAGIRLRAGSLSRGVQCGQPRAAVYGGGRPARCGPPC